MSLEAKIDALIVALDKNTAARLAGGGGDAGAAKADKPAKAGKTAKVPTEEEVKAAGTAYAKQHGKAPAKALIAKFGKDLASIPEDKRAAFIAACAEAPEAEEEDEDDDL